jgi:PIN domain nuclease of toxin-antitoxin system
MLVILYICTGEKISTASIFEMLNSSNIEKLKLSIGGGIQVHALIDEIKKGGK